jgi:hypothetical protein
MTVSMHAQCCLHNIVGEILPSSWPPNFLGVKAKLAPCVTPKAHMSMRGENSEVPAAEIFSFVLVDNWGVLGWKYNGFNMNLSLLYRRTK